jgi:hypothetical protein
MHIGVRLGWLSVNLFLGAKLSLDEVRNGLARMTELIDLDASGTTSLRV